MNGLGNDFVILDYDEYKKANIPADKLALKLCNRNFSIGADGLIIEVHHNPELAVCDGAQSLYPWQYDLLYKQIKQIAPVVGKEIV